MPAKETGAIPPELLNNRLGLQCTAAATINAKEITTAAKTTAAARFCFSRISWRTAASNAGHINLKAKRKTTSPRITNVRAVRIEPKST